MLDAAAAERVETAYDSAQAKTRAPIVCVLARASISRDADFLLGACAVALATPLPLLVFTSLSAHRIYVIQLLVAILGAVLSVIPWLRRAFLPKRAMRAAGHRAALAQFAVRGVDRTECGVLVYVSIEEHYVRVLPAESAEKAVSREAWQVAVDEALRPLAEGRTEDALTGLAARCADLLAEPFPPGAAWDPPPRRRFHVV